MKSTKLESLSTYYLSNQITKGIVKKFYNQLIGDIEKFGLDFVKSEFISADLVMQSRGGTRYSKSPSACPECGGPISIIELNKSKRTMVPGYHTMIDCDHCQWGYFSKIGISDFTKMIAESSKRGEYFDFTEYMP
jgi:hypothetical protein